MKLLEVEKNEMLQEFLNMEGLQLGTIRLFSKSKEKNSFSCNGLTVYFSFRLVIIMSNGNGLE